MRSYVPIAWLLAALPALAVADDTYYTGDGTAYTLSAVSDGNCNFMYDPGVGENYAALNNDQWDSTMNCGRCAEVSCDDDACSDTTSTVTVYIVDRCPECSEGDLDLSPTVFETLTGSSPSRYSIKWKFVDCPVSGNLQYCTKSGSSDSWLAIQPANMAEGVASMTIASQEVTMVDSAYYFLLSGGSSVDITSVSVELTSISGATVTETLSLTSDSCTEGSSNFAGGSSSQTSTTSSPATTTSTPTTTTATPTSTPTATTAAPTSTPTPTTATPTTATPTPSTSTGSSSASQTQTQSSEAGQVSNDFDSLTTDGSSNDSTLPGTVSAADDSSSGVSILQSSETGVDNTPSTQDDSDTTTTAPSSSTGSSDSTQANTESGTSASGTSTIIIVLVVCAAVGGIALAAVAFMVKKKKMDDKRNDRDDAAMLRSFDTFSSPVRITSTIAQI